MVAAELGTASDAVVAGDGGADAPGGSNMVLSRGRPTSCESMVLWRVGGGDGTVEA